MSRCTVAIPVYNRRELVRRAVESALAQDVAGLEVLAVDNCSTDGTWDVLRTYTDPRLRLVRNEANLGVWGNFNRCLALARGEFIRLLCSDDRLSAGSLPKEVAVMAGHPGVSLLSTRGRCVDEAGRPLHTIADHLPPGVYPGRDAIYNALWVHAHYGHNPFNFPSGVLLRREVALRASGFDTSMTVAGDVDLFLRVLEHGDLAVVPDVGCEVTIHADQLGKASAASGVEMDELMAIAERYRPLLKRRGSYRQIRHQRAALAV